MTKRIKYLKLIEKPWSILDIYNIKDNLEVRREEIENKLKDRYDNFRFFVLVYTKNNRIKVGAKENKKILKKFLEDLGYTSKEGSETNENSELFAIGTACRYLMKERYPMPEWNLKDTMLILHSILNPIGYEFEANIHIKALLGIEEKVKDHKIKEIIRAIRKCMLCGDS